MSSDPIKPDLRQCPRCGAPLAEDSNSDDLCPKCVLLAALEYTRLSLAPTIEHTPTSSPNSSEIELPSPKTPRYENGLPIASGAMGEVREAREIPVGRRVAMKVIREDARNEAEVRARFIEEAQITGQLEHPSIVPMHDLSIDDRGNVFYTMKRVEGQTLGAIIRKLKAGETGVAREYSLSRLLTIFQKICDAVAFAHSRGVIHRDLKPENVMVGDFGEVLVMDWGLAKVIDLPDLEITIQGELAGKDDAVHRTLDGTVMGTIGYMPPEQATGDLENIGFASDIYALGAILYELLTLRRSVEARTIDEGLDQIVTGKIASPSTFHSIKRKKGETALVHCPGNRVPQSLEAVTMRALSKSPGDRYETVEDLQAEIEAYQSGFATAAEEAGFWKHLRLFVRRHKVESMAAMLIGLVLTGSSVFLLKAWREADRQKGIAVRSEEAERKQRIEAEAQRTRAVRKTKELADQVMRDWLEKGDQLAENRFPNRALLRYAEAFRVGRDNGILSEEQEEVHRFRLGQFLGISPRLESYGKVSTNDWGIWADENRGVAICSAGGDLVIRNLQNWEVVRRISIPHGSFSADMIRPAWDNAVVIFADNSRRLNSLFLFEIGESAEADRFIELAHDVVVVNMAVDRVRNQILTIGDDGYLNRWDGRKGSLMERVRIDDSKIIGGFVEIAPDYSCCAIKLHTSNRQMALLCSLSSGLGPVKEFHSFRASSGAGSVVPNVISFSEDSSFVAFREIGRAGCVFRVDDLTRLTKEKASPVEAVYFSPGAQQLVIFNNATRQTKIADFNEGGFLAPEPFDVELNTLGSHLFQVYLDGSRFAFPNGPEQSVRFFEFPSRRPLPCVISGRQPPFASFLPDKDRLVVQRWPYRIPERGSGPKVVSGRTEGQTLQFNSDGGEVFVRDHGSLGRGSRFFNVDDSTVARELSELSPERGVSVGTCDPASGRWWFASPDRWFVQNETGEFDSVSLEERHLPGEVQPSSRILVTRKETSSDRRQIWRFPEGELVRELSGFESHWINALPAPNDRFILFADDKVPGGGQKLLKLYDVELDRMTDLPNQVQQYHFNQRMTKASFSADSRWLLARNELYSIEDGVPHHEGVLGIYFRRVDDSPGACEISPNGKWCAIVDTENRVHLFSLPSQTRHGSLLGHPKKIHTLVFSPDNRWLATGCRDGKVRLWDVQTGSLVSYPLDTGERDRHIDFIQFNDPGTHLLARVGDGGAYLWHLSPPANGRPDDLVAAAEALSRERISPQGTVNQIPMHQWEKLIREAPMEAQKYYLTDDEYDWKFGGPKPPNQTSKESFWIDPERAAEEEPAFLIQGEYGLAEPGQDWAIQVVALGGDRLFAYVLEGGFPGLGYTKGKKKLRIGGKLDDGGAVFYGRDFRGNSMTGVIDAGVFTLKRDQTVLGSFPKVTRTSPTLGKPAPEGAVVLFDGSDADAWDKDDVVENGLLRNGDISTREEFRDYHLHLEFRTPYVPYARQDFRGNSGIYHQGRYEVEIRDSFGGEGRSGDIGGLYSIRDPDLNMALPPLAWQTYDVDFTSAVFDTERKLVEPARITVRVNGVVVHDNVELTRTTPRARRKFGPGPGPILIQEHISPAPVFFRNIWLLKK